MHEKSICKTFQDLESYLSGPFKAIEGWCAAQVWQTLLPIMLVQRVLNFSAPAAEIGPYHGKFFWGLALSCTAINGHLAVDIFGLEQENADQSGVKGDREKFLAHGRGLGLAEADLKVLARDSLAVTAQTVMAQYDTNTSFSLFSVDGAHHPDYVVNDLELALALTDKHGIIIVDDYGNPRWHCVQEVVARKYLFSEPHFVPLAYSCNKLFLCHRDFLKTYREAIRAFLDAEFPDTRVYDTRRFEHDGLTILPDMNNAMRIPTYEPRMIEKIRIA
ncbi:class I SAM-dependent methyltransferase [Kordiimonas sp.]|uniref:class I SAM-dependent methyltransferase n=1 Tax=Kordiimonas sp. TaxID=1970157 RepID=UPI003A90BC43